MLTTTEYRSHWIDSAGRCYAQRRPFTAQLQPVINLDEVRAWLALSTSIEMLRLGFPGGEDDARVWYARQFLRSDQHPDEVERLAPLICDELTDDVPRYAQQPGADWRTPFVQMRERWPMPPTSGAPSEIRNLTPHAVTIGEVTLPPIGTIARATEESTPAESIRLSIPDPTGAPADHLAFDIPTCTTRYAGLVDLPAPQPGVYLIVSMVIPPVAAAQGRWTGDLLVPGEQVRNAAGAVIGCRSLARVS